MSDELTLEKLFLTRGANFGIIIQMEKIIKWQQELTISQ
jgi:hypothetical protein